ncbi:MAG: hypothetical protein ACE14P_12335 [Methanotrichaceae archaeon]
MKCIRCGRCCTKLDIYIVNPESIRSDGTMDPSYQMIFKPGGTRCPHLTYHGETAVCIIHHLLCYRGTPCDLFEQFGPEDSICIMGSYFKELQRY